jgi:hypothetical protein
MGSSASVRTAAACGALLLASCSFAGRVTQGDRTGVKKGHYYADLLGMAATELVCGVAVVAWAAPDEFAPVSGDPYSWQGPHDRSDTSKTGRLWSLIACPVAITYMASAIYGYNVTKDPNDAGGSAMGIGAMGAAFANGFLGAGQNSSPAYVPPPATFTPRPVYVPVQQTRSACASDFDCSYGSTCVKPNYSTAGHCVRSVDVTGTPTYESPSSDSIGPKMPSASDCEFDTDCPVAFRCDRGSGACIKK